MQKVTRRPLPVARQTRDQTSVRTGAAGSRNAQSWCAEAPRRHSGPISTAIRLDGGDMEAVVPHHSPTADAFRGNHGAHRVLTHLLTIVRTDARRA
jgi:hypothetical protein